MELIVQILGLACMTNLITFMGYPIQVIKKWLGLDQTKLLNCSKCLGFWVGFIYFIFTNPISFTTLLLASIVSLTAEAICRYFNN